MWLSMEEDMEERAIEEVKEEEITCYADAVRVCGGNMKEASVLWKKIKGSRGPTKKKGKEYFKEQFPIPKAERKIEYTGVDEMGTLREILQNELPQTDAWKAVVKNIVYEYSLGDIYNLEELNKLLLHYKVNQANVGNILRLWCKISRIEPSESLAKEIGWKHGESLGGEGKVKVEAKTLDDMLDKTLEDEMKEMKRLQMRKQIMELKKELQGTDVKKPDDSNVLRTHVLDDGSTVRVTDREWLEYMQAMKRMEIMKNKKEARDEEEKIPYDYHGQIIKVSPSQLPYMMSQSSNPHDDKLKEVEKRLEDERRNVDRLERERTEDRIAGYISSIKEEQDKIKQTLSQDPLDAFLSREEKLEKLGYSRGKKSLDEHSMELEKLDRSKRLDMLEHQYSSLQGKVDKFIDIAAPVIRKRLEKSVGETFEERRGKLKEYSEAEQREILQRLEKPPTPSLVNPPSSKYKKKIKIEENTPTEEG